MDLRQLRSLVALADEGQFTRAAARLHIAQPALSQHVAKLEQEFGVSLVDRTTRRVALTGAGEALVARARRMLAEAELAREELAALAGVRAGRLTLGATQTMGPVDLSALLAAFHAAHPAIELTVREDLSIVLEAALRHDELDMAFLTIGADQQHDQLASHRLAAEDLVAIVSPGHSLGGRASLRLRDLRDEVFVAFRPGATIRGQVEEAALRAGFVPRVAFETNDVSRMRALVASGLGVAVVPASDARRPGPRVERIALSDAGLGFAIFAGWRAARHLPPAARAFIELVETRYPAAAEARSTAAPRARADGR
jgi:DNA-binding transcriptional LysR family regulator